VVDPIEELVHDHRELNELLVAVHEALARVERGQSSLADELHEVRDGIEAFREALLEHFAREQEGLLPFLVGRLPDVRARTDALVVEHDRIATDLTTLVKGVSRLEGAAAEAAHAGVGAIVSAWRDDLTRFEALYAAHAKSEAAFLHDVAETLAKDPSATEQLRVLLDGI
jgi:hemerythrin-like domain-containing protein